MTALLLAAAVLTFVVLNLDSRVIVVITGRARRSAGLRLERQSVVWEPLHAQRVEVIRATSGVGKMKSVLLVLSLLAFQSAAFAEGYVVYNVRITGIFNTTRAGPNFGMRVSDHSCPGYPGYIQLVRANFSSADEYDKAVALVTAAYLNGKYVDIYDFGPAIDCNHGTFIEIHDIRNN